MELKKLVLDALQKEWLGKTDEHQKQMLEDATMQNEGGGGIQVLKYNFLRVQIVETWAQRLTI